MNLFNFVNRGGNTTANSNPVTLATDDAQIGTKVTAIPALGAGGTGLIGWLSTIVGKLAALGTNTMANSTPVTIATNDTQFAALLAKYSANDYPVGATPVVAAASAVASTITCTLPATAGKTTYLAGFVYSNNGATAASFSELLVNNTVAGGSLSFLADVAAVPRVSAPMQVSFTKPIPASAVNTTIVGTSATVGAGNTATRLVMWGYQL